MGGVFFVTLIGGVYRSTMRALSTFNFITEVTHAGVRSISSFVSDTEKEFC